MAGGPFTAEPPQHSHPTRDPRLPSLQLKPPPPLVEDDCREPSAIATATADWLCKNGFALLNEPDGLRTRDGTTSQAASRDCSPGVRERLASTCKHGSEALRRLVKRKKRSYFRSKLEGATAKEICEFQPSRVPDGQLTRRSRRTSARRQAIRSSRGRQTPATSKRTSTRRNPTPSATPG